MRAVAYLFVGMVMVLAVACTPRPTVPIPPDDAAPVDVVGAYAAALAVRDCTTARALFAEPRVDGGGPIQERWCDAGITISNLQVTRSNEHRVTGGIATTADMATGWEHAWEVGATFDVTGGDISLRDGTYPMTFLLVRSSSADPWRLVGFGMG